MLNWGWDFWIIAGKKEERAPGSETKQKRDLCIGQLAARLYHK